MDSFPCWKKSLPHTGVRHLHREIVHLAHNFASPPAGLPRRQLELYESRIVENAENGDPQKKCT